MAKKRRNSPESADGLERAPISSLSDTPRSERGVKSAEAFARAHNHDRRIKERLGIGAPQQFCINQESLIARKQMLADSKEHSHAVDRTSLELGILVLATVTGMENECRRSRVLDIGCGRGRFGEQMARNARAKLTFLDMDPQIMAGISPRAGDIVIGDGRLLPFEDESFEKTFSTFSSIVWAETPVETIQALNEALRVTETGGSTFLLPALVNTTELEGYLKPTDKAQSKEWADFSLGCRVWALQDHVLLHALHLLAVEEYCSITWSQFGGPGMKTGHEFEFISAIVDKKKPIPPDVLQVSLDYAKSFYEPDKNT